MGQVKKFYYDGWGTVRDFNKDTAVVIHDAFLDPQSYWNGFMNFESGVNDVILGKSTFRFSCNPPRISESTTNFSSTRHAHLPNLYRRPHLPQALRPRPKRLLQHPQTKWHRQMDHCRRVDRRTNRLREMAERAGPWCTLRRHIRRR